MVPLSLRLLVLCELTIECKYKEITQKTISIVNKSQRIFNLKWHTFKKRFHCGAHANQHTLCGNMSNSITAKVMCFLIRAPWKPLSRMNLAKKKEQQLWRQTLDNGSQLYFPAPLPAVLQQPHSTGLIKMYDFSSFDETKYNFSTSNATERKKVGCNCNFLAKSAHAARYIDIFKSQYFSDLQNHWLSFWRTRNTHKISCQKGPLLQELLTCIAL
ncbi:uncharacterized protein LOC108031858 isoform X2 [Drosophila biarmipes]|uniref:uncharacterized protein LOC108031858 isoform X2 n=1 Tax=Drosophila biarmipes TaxID=125945 RepID=UPI0021CC6023|nr:uncharacterized protein LOC108031858 isoform X2 [Drosophila biarmipes]